MTVCLCHSSRILDPTIKHVRRCKCDSFYTLVDGLNERARARDRTDGEKKGVVEKKEPSTATCHLSPITSFAGRGENKLGLDDFFFVRDFREGDEVEVVHSNRTG